MQLKQINQDSPNPLYIQIKDTILDYLEHKDVNKNTLLPSERELSELFQVSRMTVRKSLDLLTDDGILFRVPGKGTYTKVSKIEQPLLVLTSFTEAIKQEGYTPGSKLLDLQELTGSDYICQQLGICVASRVIFIKRLRYVDNLPFCLACSYLPYHLGKDLTEIELQNESLYSLFYKKSNVSIKKTKLFIEAIDADKTDALFLTIKSGSSLFYLHGTVKDQNDKIIEYFEVKYRGDKLKFSTESI